MTDQLALDVEPRRPNPNAHFFDADGKPRRLLWCSDAVRIGFNRGIDVACPYLGDRARYRPVGGCCKDLVRKERDERCAT